MTIYVDGLKRYFNTYWCHMMTDEDIEELHTMARSLALKRRWFQPKPYPHYDLMQGKRARAIEAGAVSVDSKKMFKLCKR